MSDSDRVQFAWARESTYLTDPGTDLRAMPRVDGGIQPAMETTRSQTTRSDRQLSSTLRTDISGAAQINFELTAQNYDEMMRGAIMSDADWSTDVGFSGTLSADGTTSKFSGTSLNTNAYVGQWIYVSGMTNSGNNGWHRVTATATDELTVASTLTTEASTASCTVKGSYILNGTTQSSYLLQEHYEDNTTDYQYMLGAVIENLSLALSKGNLITGSLSWRGGSVSKATSCQGSGTVTDAYDEDPASEVDGFDAVWIDDSQLSVDVLDFSAQLAVALRPRRGLGGNTLTSMGMGALAATGGLSLYREDNTLTYLANYLAFTNMRIAVALNMGNSDRYVIEWPRAVFTSPPAQAPGLDQDVLLDFDWSAEPGGAFGASSTEKTVIVTRVQGS